MFCQLSIQKVSHANKTLLIYICEFVYAYFMIMHKPTSLSPPQGEAGLPGPPGAPGKEGKRVSKQEKMTAFVVDLYSFDIV